MRQLHRQRRQTLPVAAAGRGLCICQGCVDQLLLAQPAIDALHGLLVFTRLHGTAHCSQITDVCWGPCFGWFSAAGQASKETGGVICSKFYQSSYGYWACSARSQVTSRHVCRAALSLRAVSHCGQGGWDG